MGQKTHNHIEIPAFVIQFLGKKGGDRAAGATWRRLHPDPGDYMETAYPKVSRKYGC